MNRNSQTRKLEKGQKVEKKQKIDKTKKAERNSHTDGMQKVNSRK